MGNNKNTTNVTIALLTGAAIGAVLGILFAPEKGSDTRSKLTRKANGLTDAMNEKVQELIERFDTNSDHDNSEENHTLKNRSAAAM
jgi:gas vesicle protein